MRARHISINSHPFIEAVIYLSYSRLRISSRRERVIEIAPPRAPLATRHEALYKRRCERRSFLYLFSSSEIARLLARGDARETGEFQKRDSSTDKSSFVDLRLLSNGAYFRPKVSSVVSGGHDYVLSHRVKRAVINRSASVLMRNVLRAAARYAASSV